MTDEDKTKLNSQNWFLTWNNPDIEFDACWHPDQMSFLVGQYEKGSKTGTLHYHLYFRLKKRARFNAVKKMFPKANIDKRRGSHEKAFRYCTKERTRVKGPWVYGDPPQPGKRTDLEVMAARLRDGATDKELFDEHPATYMRYHRACTHVREVLRDTTPHRTEGIYLCGDTGCGKTTYLLQQYPDADWVTFDGKFHADYTGAEVVIYDDVDIKLMSRAVKLTLVNICPRSIPVKGSFMRFNPKLVIIVSNEPYEEFTQMDPAVERRYVYQKFVPKVAC